MPDEQGIRFMPPAAERWVVSNYCDLIWAILGACEGRSDRETILANAVQQFPAIPADDIAQVFDHLASMGVLVDGREAFKALGPLLAIPSPYPRVLSPAEVRAYTASSRLPVAAGSLYELAPDSTSALAQMQGSRHSCRNFCTERGLERALLGRLLACAYSIPLRSTPSGGGLYPLKIYLILTVDQGGLAKGYYEYDPERHVLIRYDDVDQQELEFAFNTEPALHGAPAIVVIAADTGRQPGKYGNRGYLYTVLEAGHAAQNLLLAAAEVGVSSLEYGDFQDDVLATELGMDPDGNSRVRPLVTVALGYPSDAARSSFGVQLEGLMDALVGPDSPVQRVEVNVWPRGEGPGFISATAVATSAVDPTFEMTASGMAASTSRAMIAAIGEAYERYCSGRVRVDLTASASSLTQAGQRWLDPRVVAPLTAEQLALSGLEPFNPARRWQWVRGTTASGAAVWVPVDLVFYPCSTNDWGRGRCSLATSSGVAAYTNAEEATRRGLLELVERHALMSTWFGRVAPPRVPVDLLSRHLRRRVAHWESRQRRVHVLNTSAQAQGAVATIVVIESDTYPFFVSGAAATLTSFEEAVAKALQEAELALCGMLNSPPVRPLRPEEVSDRCNDHGAFYGASHARTRELEWLWCGLSATFVPVVSTTFARLLRELDAVSVQLSPDGVPLVVTRVLSSRLVPIAFGYGRD